MLVVLYGTAQKSAKKLVLQGLLGPALCDQLGQEALDSTVTQTAGLLPRDLQALAADACAAAAARGLNTLCMLPQLKALQPPDPAKLLPHSSKANGEPGSLLDGGVDGQVGQLDRQGVAGDGQGMLVGPVEVCEADVQASLDRVRQRTATVIGAPKVCALLLTDMLKWLCCCLAVTMACQQCKEWVCSIEIMLLSVARLKYKLLERARSKATTGCQDLYIAGMPAGA